MMIFLFPRLMNEKSPHIEGDIAIVDPTGVVAPGVREYLVPTAIAARRAEDKKELEALAAKKLGAAAKSVPGDMLSKKLDQALGEVPQLDVVVLPAGANIDNEKQPLKVVGSEAKRLALIVVHPDAVTRGAGQSDYGAYDLYVRGKLDDRIEDDIRESLKHSIIAA